MEALESGVFRSDLPTRFKLDPAAYQVCPDSFLVMFMLLIMLHASTSAC